MHVYRRPKLQDTRTRILVSRDEQAKTLKRIRRAEAYRRERLKRSIKANDQLADEIKAGREKNSKAVLLSRLRLKREKAAIREKPDAWASLHSDGSSWGSSLNAAEFSDEDGGSLASSLTQDKFSVASSSSPPSRKRDEPQPPGRRNHPHHSPVQDSQPLASSRLFSQLVSQSPVSLEQVKASAHRVEEHRREPPRHGATEGAAALLPQTPPPSLLCGRITDAETGEPLELRRRRWEFPKPSRRADTAGPCGGGGDGPGDCIAPTDPEDDGAWQSLRFEEGKDERCRETPFSADAAQDRQDGLETAQCCGAGTRGDGDDGRRSRQSLEDADEKGQRGENTIFESASSNQHVGVLRGGKNFTVSDDGNDNGSSGDSEWVGGNRSSTLTDSAQNVDRMSSLSSPPGVSCKKRPCTADAGSCFTSNAQSRGTRRISSPAPGLRTPRRRCEPLTPRSTKRVLSPFWIPPPQEPPFSLIGPSTMAEGRSREAPCTRRGTGSDGDFQREKSLGVDGGGSESSRALVRGGSGWAGVEKCGASSGFSEMLDEAPDERVRQNMVHAQEIRDRYLSQVQQMIKDESAEEKRRVAALRAAAGHPLRCRRLQLRHDQERGEKRTLISWIRRDIELIVVQRMAALGLIR